MQNRFRSKALWVAVLSLILFVSKTYFNYDIPHGNELIDSILLVFTLAGIFNNPTDKENF